MNLTQREIFSQYEALDRTVRYMRDQGAALAEFAKGWPWRRLLFLGCGSSFSIAKSLCATASLDLDVPCAALAAGDLLLHAGRYGRLLDGALMVVLSRSGQTSEVLRAIEAARTQGAEIAVLSIVCAEGTPLEALSGFCVRLPWAFDESVCQTRCVTNMYAAGVMTVRMLQGVEDAAGDFDCLAGFGGEYLASVEPLMRELAGRDWDKAVVLADYELAGLAEEGALAFKEIAQLPSNRYNVLDVRHGPMVLVDGATLVLVHAGELDSPYVSALVADLAAKNALVVVHSHRMLALPEGTVSVVMDQALDTPASGLSFLLLCQLTAYYKALARGCDPDQPEGLAPWIQLGG